MLWRLEASTQRHQSRYFDLDGTFVESEAVWTEAKQYIANREKINVSEQVMLAYVGRSVTDDRQRLYPAD